MAINRTIKVLKYKFTMEDVIQDNFKTEIIPTGYITDILTATAQVQNMGDPVINIVCDLTPENFEICQVSYIIETKAMEKGLVDNYTIRTVSIDTEQNTIALSAEPIFNELRNTIGFINTNRIITNSNTFQLGMEMYKIRDNSAYSTSRLYMDDTRTFNLPYAGKSGLEMIGGTELSVKDLYGGEFSKYKHNITQYRTVGNINKNYRLKLGVNVKGLKYTIDTTEVVNAVLHYYKYTDEERPNFPQVIYRTNSNTTSNNNDNLTRLGDTELRSGKIIGKDWGEESEIFGDPPPEQTEAQIRTKLIEASDTWNQANQHLNDPKINIELDFFTLRNSIDMEQFNDILALQLGDTVSYYHAPLNWEISARVNGYTYNILTDTNEKIVVGNGLNTILDII